MRLTTSSRVLRTVALTLGFLLGLFAGLAYASGHTVNGIYHGRYSEGRSGGDYHHAWTEHGSYGFRYAAVVKGDWLNGWTNRCTADNYYNESVKHVHCTAYFDGGSGGWLDTGCTYDHRFSEAAADCYIDGHGIYTHIRDG